MHRQGCQALAPVSGISASIQHSLQAVPMGARSPAQRWNRVSGSPGQRFWPSRVGSRVSVSDPVFDPVLSFDMRIYRGVVFTE